jgi:TetR/AcrR family transcriptional regulator, tetracycline repressor protein
MGRPLKPLISKRKTAIAALRIIDQEGVKALSVRHLAKRLNVRAQSFYHHFRKKRDILSAAILLAFEEVRPDVPVSEWVGEHPEDWREWVTTNSLNYRRMLMRHPNLIPVLTAHGPYEFSVGAYDAQARQLEAAGLERSAIIPMLLALEAFTIGTVLVETSVSGGNHGQLASKFPFLYSALKDAMPIEEWFISICGTIIETLAPREATKLPVLKSRQRDKKGA